MNTSENQQNQTYIASDQEHFLTYARIVLESILVENKVWKGPADERDSELKSKSE